MYGGEQQDPETGYYYLRARCYDSVSGRFVSEDDLGTRLSGIDLARWLLSGLFGYADGNPIRFVDPSGHVAQGSWVSASTAAWAL